MEDAEIAFFIQGAHANTCKSAINHLRSQGVKAGMVRPRWVRPWPTEQIAEALSHVKAWVAWRAALLTAAQREVEI